MDVNFFIRLGPSATKMILPNALAYFCDVIIIFPECGRHSPDTEDEPVSEFEADSVPSKAPLL
jgi:hypothetical protein